MRNHDYVMSLVALFNDGKNYRVCSKDVLQGDVLCHVSTPTRIMYTHAVFPLCMDLIVCKHWRIDIAQICLVLLKNRGRRIRCFKTKLTKWKLDLMFQECRTLPARTGDPHMNY